MENKKNEINKDQKQEIKKDTDKVSGGWFDKATPPVGSGYGEYWNPEYKDYVLQGVKPLKVPPERFNPKYRDGKEAREEFGVPAGTVANGVKDIISTNPDHQGAHPIVGGDLSQSAKDRLK